MIAFLKRYASCFRGGIGQAALGVTLAFLTGLTLVPVPLLVGRAFDQAIPTRQFDALVNIGIAMLTLQILSGLGTVLTRHVNLGVIKEMTARLRQECVARLLAAPRSFYSRQDVAALHDVVVQETERVDVMGNSLLGQVVPAIVLSLGICGVLVALNWMLFLAMLAVLPLNVLASRRLGARVRDRVTAYHESFGRFSRGILFLVRSIDVVRIQTAEAFETGRQGSHVHILRDTSAAMAWAGVLYSVVQQVIIAAAGIVVLVVGGSMTARNLMSVGDLLSFFAGLLLLRGPLHAIMSGLPRIMEGAQSFGNLMAFLDNDEREPYRGRTRVPFSGAVSLRDVSFAYGETPVLSSVTLDLTPGDIVALIGRNGSGKSTVVNLIMGFYRPVSGALEADGVRYDELDIKDLRRSIAVVTQDPILVPGTISENLTYGVADVSIQEMVRASRIAGVDAFATRYPLGYDTPIGEDGKLLSGGQRQRLSLARALISKPRLLILDEPMNHLDEKDTVEFLRRLTAAAGRPAVLLISHREDVSVADRVYRLESGVLSDVDDTRPAPVGHSRRPAGSN